MTGPIRGHRPGEPAYRRALVALTAMGLATFAMVYSVQPLLAVVAADLGVGAASATMLMTVTTFAIAIAVLPLARLSERVGRQQVILGALAVAVVAGVASALVPWFWLILLLRGVQGAALAGVPVAALAWVAEEIDPTAITRVGGLYIAGTSVGGMGGRLLAGFASEIVGWRWAVVVVCLVAATLTVVVRLTLPASRRARGRAGAAPADGADPTAGARRARRALYGLGFLGMAMFVGVYNVISFRTSLPPYALGAGLGSMFYLSYVAGTVSSAVAGRIVTAIGIRRTVLTGLVLCVLGILTTLATSMLLIWVGLGILAAGFFIVHAVASANAARLSPRPSDGSGRYTLYYYLGSSIGGVLLGYAWDLGQWGATVAGALAITGLAFLLVPLLPRRGPTPVAAPTTPST